MAEIPGTDERGRIQITSNALQWGAQYLKAVEVGLRSGSHAYLLEATSTIKVIYDMSCEVVDQALDYPNTYTNNPKFKILIRVGEKGTDLAFGNKGLIEGLVDLDLIRLDDEAPKTDII